MDRWFSNEIRPLVPLYITMFMETVGSGLVASVLNVVAIQDLRCTNFQVGIIWASFNLAQIVGSLIMGYFSDIFRRKYILILILIWTGCGYIFTAFAGSFEIYLVSRILTGIIGGSYSIAASILSSNLGLESLPFAFGRLGTVMSLGFAVGPLISTLITAVSYEKPSSKVQGYYFYSAFGIYVLAAACATQLSLAVTPVQTSEIREKSLSKVTPGLLFIWLSRFFATCGVTSIYVTQVALWMDYLQLSRIWITLNATISGLVVSITQGFIFPNIIKKVKSHVTLATGISLVGLSSILIGPITQHGSIPFHYVCLVMFWLGVGLLEPGTPVAVAEHLRLSERVSIKPKNNRTKVSSHASSLSCSDQIATKSTVTRYWPKIVGASIHTGLAMGVTSAMKYAASLLAPIVVGYAFDIHDIYVYYVTGGVALLGSFSVLIAFVLYRRRVLFFRTFEKREVISTPVMSSTGSPEELAADSTVDLSSPTPHSEIGKTE